MVTIHQYIPVGISVNPLASPSIRNISVPKTIDITTIKYTNTSILFLLAFNASLICDCCPSIDILSKIENRRNNLKALNVTKKLVLGIKNDKYIGSNESKSMIP